MPGPTRLHAGSWSLDTARRRDDDREGRGRERRCGAVGRGHRSPRTTGSTSGVTQSSGTGFARRFRGPSRPASRSELGDRRPSADPSRPLWLRARPRRRAPRLVRRAGQRADPRRSRSRPTSRRRARSTTAATVHAAVEPTAPEWERRCSTSTPRATQSSRERSRLRAGSAGTSQPWAPGPGRVPGFAHPLLCPSRPARHRAGASPRRRGAARLPPTRGRAVGLRRLARPDSLELDGDAVVDAGEDEARRRRATRQPPPRGRARRRRAGTSP